MKKFAADTHIVSGFGAGIASVNAQNTRGRWVKLDEWDSITIVSLVPAVAAQAQTLSVRQATALAGTAAKAVTGLRFYVADHATALGDVVSAVDGDSAVSTVAEAAMIWCEVTADQLDVTGGFSWVQGSLARTANAAQNGAMLYVMRGGRIVVDPPDQVTALA